MTPPASTQVAKDNKTASTKPPTNGASGAKDAKDAKAAKAAKAAKDAKDTVASTGPTASTETETDTPKRLKKSVFIVTGEILEFANARDAEAFLNSGKEVPEAFRVIKGSLIEQKQIVSLR